MLPRWGSLKFLKEELRQLNWGTYATPAKDFALQNIQYECGETHQKHKVRVFY